ncbi:hypothetical protein C0J52_07704 [Blattella germanica]|nr:hypothetical protein C0J52_07704 [Blattella germanica]
MQWRSSRNTTVKLSKEHRILSWWRKKSLKENCFFKCINSFSRGITNSFKEWLDKTSFNVISYVGNMEILIIERVFWFALFAAAIYGSCKSAWQMIKDNEPIIDELHVSQVEIPYKFPTFTICGQIPYPGLPQEIEPDPDISEWPPEIRGCRHPDEVLANQFYPKYSYSACIASCRAQEMMQKCGCVHPMSAISETIYLPAEWKNLNCGCVRSCSDTSYYGVFQNEKSDQKGIVSIKVIPGHEKIRLRLKTGKLDVFVMVGGMFGLFVGASMMSIVEVIMFFTIRFLTNIIRQFHN